MKEFNVYMNGQKLGVPTANLPSLEEASITDCNEHMFSMETMKCVKCSKCAHEHLNEMQIKSRENLKQWDEIR